MIKIIENMSKMSILETNMCQNHHFRPNNDILAQNVLKMKIIRHLIIFGPKNEANA